MNAKFNTVDRGASGMMLVEESIHLLRQTAPVNLCIYYLGTVPFALGVLFFWARVTWFSPPSGTIAAGAAVLVVLFVLMKTAHSTFCARLYAQRLGRLPVPMGRAEWMQTALAQLRVQAWGFWILPVSFILGVPFAWAYAYFQSASVLGDGETLAADSIAQARLWPMQNHLGQLLLLGTWLTVWINTAAAFWFLPWLANRLLGLQNIYGFSGWWIANTTFLASTAMIAWLFVDPIVKAFFTLRVFYGRARRTGEDLRVDLRRAQVGRRIAPGLAATVSVVLMLVGWVTPALAAEVERPMQPVDKVQLDRAIDRVLAGDDFAWRLRPMPAVETAVDEAELGLVQRAFRSIAKAFRSMMAWVRSSWRDIREWFRGIFPERSSTAKNASSGLAALETLMWIFVISVVGLLIGIAVLAWRRRSTIRKPELHAQPVAVVIPDLTDEKTQAAQLPTEGWLLLAREQMERGEWRLAWRALYLATLTRLAADGLLSLARFKTNLDYERELRRRAVTRQDVISWFSIRRGGYEAVWYGRAEANEDSVRQWLAELERANPA